MTWLTALLAVAAVAAIAAITGIKPRGTRHVARTSMMGAARVALGVMVIIFIYLIYRVRSGG